MFRFLDKSPIDFKTRYHDTAYDDLFIVRRSRSNEELEIELVQRSFASCFGLLEGQITPAHAKNICIAQINRTPHHNFFDLAYALHEPNLNIKETYLMTAAKAHLTSDSAIAGQAAYQLAQLYTKDHQYIKGQAWLVHAVNLKNNEAIETFKTKGMCNSDPLGPPNILTMHLDLASKNKGVPSNENGDYPRVASLLMSSLTAVVLSGRSIPTDHGFNNHLWLSIGVDLRNQLFRANRTINPIPALMLYKDSHLGEIATSAIEDNCLIFYNFFKYCAENQIISLEVDNAIMNFLAQYRDQYQIVKVETPIYKHNSKIHLYYIRTSKSVLFCNTLTNTTIELKISTDQFDKELQPTTLGRLATIEDLKKIALLSGEQIPSLMDSRVRNKVKSRLHAKQKEEVKTNTVMEKSIEFPKNQPIIVKHHIPQYIPPEVLEVNTTSNSILNTQDFENQFPMVYKGALSEDGIFAHKPKLNPKVTESELAYGI